MEKPYYVIDFSATDCFIDIRVNDVPVICMNVEGQISTIYPVNTAILESGIQQVSYKILPILGELSLSDTADFSGSVWLYDAGGDSIQKVNEIDQYKIQKDTTGIPVPAYAYAASFNAEVPYKIISWQNSTDLNDVKDLRKLVDEAYKKIEKLITAKQYSLFAELFKIKENNSCSSMYLSEEEKNQRITRLTEILKNGFLIIPSSPNDTMITYGNGKLVCLRTPKGESALRLYNSETKEGLNLDVLFHLEKGSNELSII